MTQDEYERQKYLYAMASQQSALMQMSQGLLGSSNRYQLGIADPARAAPPVSPPEPNKVLLLLGEDE